MFLTNLYSQYEQYKTKENQSENNKYREKKSMARMERNVKMKVKVRNKVVCEGSRSRKYSRLGYNEDIKTFAQYGGVKTVSGICHFVDMNVWD